MHFDADLAARIAGPGGWPVIPTMAGHDAGVLSAAGIPTAMLFVRNPTGVSHSPDEHAETADCLAGVEALADTLERLARERPTGSSAPGSATAPCATACSSTSRTGGSPGSSTGPRRAARNALPA